MEKAFLICQLKVILENMITFKGMQQVKEIITKTGCLLDYLIFLKIL